MGQLNSDSSLCKWHLNAGKQLTNKEAAVRLRLTDPLRLSIHAVGLSLGFISCQMTRNITMNTKLLLQGFPEDRNELHASCWGFRGRSCCRNRVVPPHGPPTSPGRTLPSARPGFGLSLITPPLLRLSALWWLLIQILSSFRSNSRPTFSTKSTSLINHRSPLTSDFL